MFKNRLCICFCFLWALSGGLGARAQGLLTLSEAVRIGLERNLDISIARTEARMSENNVHIGKAGFLPKLDLTGSRNRNVNDTKARDFGGTEFETRNVRTDAAGAGAGLTWTVFDGWNMFINYKKLQESGGIGQLNLKSEIEDQIANITDAYFEIVKQAHLLRVLSEAVAISEERFRLAEYNFKLGSGSQFDVLRARVDLNADQSARLKQETAVKNAKIGLSQVIGSSIDSEFSVVDSVEVTPRMVFADLKEVLFKRNTRLLIAQRNQNLARLNIKGTASRWYPKLGLFSNYNFNQSRYQTGQYALNETRGYTVGATASFNLFNGFSDWVDLQNAKLDLRVSELDLENLKRSLDAALLQEYNNYSQASDLLSIERDNLAIAKQTLDIARERFKVGSYTPLELREAQNAYIAVESRLVGARYAVKTAENELMRLTGQYLQEKIK